MTENKKTYHEIIKKKNCSGVFPKDNNHQSDSYTIAALKAAITEKIQAIYPEEYVPVIINFARQLQQCLQLNNRFLDFLL